MAEKKKIALAGIPNSGKTTFFNAVTGSRQKVGNWPGVTVEKIEGNLALKNIEADLVDLPGTYNLSPDTEDQKVAERAIREDENDLVINIVDASNLSRNLYLTMDILKLQRNIVVVLNMTDIAKKEGITVNPNKLSGELGIPVIPVISIDHKSVKKAKTIIEDLVTGKTSWETYPKIMVTEQENTQEIYDKIDTICEKVIENARKAESTTDKLDRIFLNKFAALPIFLTTMFLTFWFAVSGGGIFIDFFDIIAGLIFVDGLGTLLGLLGSPDWVITLLAGGIGAGIQTVATFIPVVFFMFLAMAILEDSGIMARIAVITDKFMKKIGLPGNSFIPLMVGFGCTVPAIMAARTMSTKRDRYLTIFMAPFMSCGARLPVYALFCASLFGSYSSLIVLLIYISGIVMAILTGLLLKGTILRGTASSFVMDLPIYHVPRAGSIFKQAGIRLWSFIKKAGLIIMIAVTILGFMNSIGVSDGRVVFGTEDTEESFLAYAGKGLQPLFEPMGVEDENWPASVALFTGLFAKEAIVGTINSLYSHMEYTGAVEAEAESAGAIDVGTTIAEAFISIGEGFTGLFTSADLLGVGIISEEAGAIQEELDTDDTTFTLMRKYFSPAAGFAYILFVLLYFPCLAAMGAARKELGGFYTAVQMVYLTILAWSVSTIFFQIAQGHDPLFIVIAVLILGFIVFGMTILGRIANPVKEVL